MTRISLPTKLIIMSQTQRLDSEEEPLKPAHTNDHLINHTKKQIQIDDFQSELNHNLLKFRNENLFTDIFIYVEGVEFPCHKVILCASSSYFKAMFSCDLKESRLGKVFIENISSWTMKRLLDFIYTGNIEINYENVIDIFNAAAMFQLYKLADKCTDYIEEHIDLSNCIDIHVFASLHQLVKLEKDTFQFILDNFMQLINSPPTIPTQLRSSSINLDDINLTNQLINSVNSSTSTDSVYFSDFVLLSEPSFQALIKSDLLNVSREIYVYYAIKKWIEYQIILNQKPNNSKLIKTYENLFKHIRLNALTKDELEFILTNDKLVKANKMLLNHLKSFLDSTQQTHLDDIQQITENTHLDSVNTINSDTNLTSSIRPSTIPREYLCVLQFDSFQFYDFYKSKWDSLTSWPPNNKNSFNLNNLNGYSTCIINNILYILGGYVNDFQLVDTVLRFDPIKNEWIQCRPMLRKRAFHLSISLISTTSSNFIFLFYGICYNESNETTPLINTGSSLLNQCHAIDYYNIDKNQWFTLNTTNNNSLLNHHIFQSINNQNRSIITNIDDLTNQDNLKKLIEHQLSQSKTIVSLRNLIYILKENCINCYEFNSNLEQLVCLPYFRLPTNLSQFSLACAFSIKTTTSCSLSSSLFSWYSDTEESTSLLSSPQITNRNLESTLKNDIDIQDDTSDDEPKTNEMTRNKKETLIYLINAQKRTLYEFYPAKNKLKKLPNLLLKHSATETFVLNIKSKLYVTGGIVDNEDEVTSTLKQSTNDESNNEIVCSNAIEILNEDKDCWSIFKNNLNDNHNETIQLTKHFFKLKMSLI